MGAEPSPALNGPWIAAAIAVAGGVFTIAAVSGLVLLPYAQANLRPIGLWDAICTAAGVPRLKSAGAPVQPLFPTSRVVVTSQSPKRPDADSIGRGATLAMHCAICHDAVGNSDAVPKLAGQDQVAVFKELEDFKSGARSSAVMNPFAQHMTEQQVKDFAAYYAFLPPSSWSRPAAETAPHIIVYGAPMRGIAPCGACHGAIERKSGAPSLDGQPAAYIQSQLEGFANGARHNDINQQMRNIARGMTGEERNAVASYYAPRPLGQGPAEHNHP